MASPFWAGKGPARTRMRRDAAPYAEETNGGSFPIRRRRIEFNKRLQPPKARRSQKKRRCRK